MNLPSGESWLEDVNWNDDGLVAAVTQDKFTGRVLTLAWMNRDSLKATAESGYATYWSRSRGKLWRKGEQSGNCQKIISIQLDCDADAIVLYVEQEGGIACHTGRHSCFYRVLGEQGWEIQEPVLKEPEEMYGKSNG